MRFGVVGVPLGFVDFGVVEGLADDVFDAHAGGGIARLLGLAAEAAGCGLPARLGFSPRANLMPGVAPSKIMALGVLAPAHFERQGFAADGVGGAVQNIGGGDAAGERAVDGDVLGIEDVVDVDHGRDATRCLR